MSDFPAGLGEPRPQSPSPGRGGRFDDASRRSPPPGVDRWTGNPTDRGALAPPGGSSHRGRSPDFGRKRRRDESPPSRDRYIPNYEREPHRERERRDNPHPFYAHDRGNHAANRYAHNSDSFDDPYRRNGNGYRDEGFGFSQDRGLPPRGGPSYPRSHLTPPSELPYLVSFRYFADFMRATSPHIAEDKEKMAEQWKRYRLDVTRKQLVGFFEENKTKPWFYEKYQVGPEFEEMRERLKKQGREGKVEQFLQRLASGALDIVNYDYLSPSKKFSVPLPSLGEPLLNGHQPDVAAGTLTAQEVEGLENNQQGLAAPPIPDVKVSVMQPEGEPKADDPSTNMDAEGEDYDDADDDFANSVVEAISGPAAGLAMPSALGTLIGESMKGKTGSEDIVILPPSENQLFIKSISPDISRVDLENHCKQIEGFDYLALSDPHTGKKLHRVGWVSFVPGTDMQAAERTLSESKINNFTLHMIRAERPAFQKLRICPGITNTPERLSKDLSQIRKLAVHLENDYFGSTGCEDQRGSTAIDAKIQALKDEMLKSHPNEHAMVTEAKAQTPDLLMPNNDGAAPPSGESKEEADCGYHVLDKKALDLYLYYVRTAFNCCYYCACVCDFQEELLRRCAKHVRKPAPSYPPEPSSTPTPTSHRRSGSSHTATQKSNELNWGRALDDRLSLILARGDVDPRDFGGERVDDEIHRLCQPQITDEGAGKFRCKNCSKLFKAMNFIEKHIMAKHGEVIDQESVQRIKYLNNYILDPSHTSPQPPAAPDSGNTRPNIGVNAPVNPQHGMMPNMGAPLGSAPDFHPGGYPTMMNNPMGAHGNMVLGGAYPSYSSPMYTPYAGHPYQHMAGPSPMFANGPMMAGPQGNHAGPYGSYYMNPMGNYPPPFQPPHHQVYHGLPQIPSMAQGRMPNGHPRRLGDRISRNFAGDNFLPVPPHDAKRNRRDDTNRPGDRLGANSGVLPSDIISNDPRSKTVLAYNDLDVPAGDEIVLNY